MTDKEKSANPNRLRTKGINIMLTPEEHKRYTKLAHRLETSFAEMVRSQLDALYELSTIVTQKDQTND